MDESLKAIHVLIELKKMQKKENLIARTQPKSLGHVRAAVHEIDPRLNVSRQSDGSYYFWSDDEELGLMLARCYSTTICVTHWSHQSIETWQDDARSILKKAYTYAREKVLEAILSEEDSPDIETLIKTGIDDETRAELLSIVETETLSAYRGKREFGGLLEILELLSNSIETSNPAKETWEFKEWLLHHFYGSWAGVHSAYDSWEIEYGEQSKAEIIKRYEQMKKLLASDNRYVQVIAGMIHDLYDNAWGFNPVIDDIPEILASIEEEFILSSGKFHEIIAGEKNYLKLMQAIMEKRRRA